MPRSRPPSTRPWPPVSGPAPGTLRLLPNKPSTYMPVTVDGVPSGNAPNLRGMPVHAGKHVIQFYDAKDNQLLVDTQTVMVEDGKTVTVTAH